jgi:MFS family permease
MASEWLPPPLREAREGRRGKLAAPLAVGFGMNAWIESLSGYAISWAVWTLGEIRSLPASMALVADLAPADLRGRYQGAYAMASSRPALTVPECAELSSR